MRRFEPALGPSPGDKLPAPRYFQKGLGPSRILAAADMPGAAAPETISADTKAIVADNNGLLTMRHITEALMNINCHFTYDCPDARAADARAPRPGA